MVDALVNELTHVRTRLVELVARVDEHVVAGQHSPIMGPILWDLGHIAAFEELWLVKAVDGWRPSDGGGMPPLFDALVNQRSVRGQLALPRMVDALDRLERVREASLERVGRGLGSEDPLVSDGFVWNMVAQHEAWHIETILAALNLREDFVLDRATPPPAGAVELGQVRFEGGTYALGTDDLTRAYDNERPAHPVELRPFAIARDPVTVAQYAEFVADGGYAERSHWSDAGWAWQTERRAAHPHGWRDGGVLRFGRIAELDPSEPVQHVCFWEAQAFARWAGARLPTEAEWEIAARRGDGEPDLTGAHIECGACQPFGVGAVGGAGASGCRGMFGNVWEWTSSIFDGYPGFRVFPYREYSAPFFADGMPVLRGGSWASGRAIVRPSLRSWDLPLRRETIFVGFRLAWDA